MTEFIDNKLETESAVNPGQIITAVEQLSISKDTDERARAIARTSAEELISYAALLHSVLAPNTDLNPTEFAMSVGAPDGSDKRPLVDPEARLEIFRQVAHLIHQLARRLNNQNSQAYLDRAANLVGLGIVLAHPYKDGNGRTARVLAHLIKKGYDGSEDRQDEIALLGENRPKEGFRITSYVPTLDGLEMSPHQLLNAAAATHVPLEARQLYEMSSLSEFRTPYS